MRVEITASILDAPLLRVHPSVYPCRGSRMPLRQAVATDLGRGRRGAEMEMTDRKVFPLTETLAQQLFIARMGHTGMTWDQLDDEFGQGEYRAEASRVLEGWWNPDKPLVVLDLSDDEMWLAESVQGARETDDLP